MILDEWKNAQRQRVSRYAHFDTRISLEQCWKYISSPESVAIHAFMPFIHYTITTRKVKNGKKQPPKKREIFYAAHKDAWIYRYYSYLLNEQYNARVQQDGIDSVAVAYRNNFKGRNNIDFANDAFRFIQLCRSCCVILRAENGAIFAIQANHLPVLRNLLGGFVLRQQKQGNILTIAVRQGQVVCG